MNQKNDLAVFAAPKTTIGKALVPLSAGHQLLISQFEHPLATGNAWSDSDVLLALFIFSKPASEHFALLADDAFEAEFLKFVDTLPAGQVHDLGHDMISHWMIGNTTEAAGDSSGATTRKATPLRLLQGLKNIAKFKIH